MWTKLGIVVLLCGISVPLTKAQTIHEVVLTCSFELYAINEFYEYTCILRDVEFDFTNPFYYVRIEGEHEAGRTNADVINLSIQASSINTIPANIFQVLPNIATIECFQAGVTVIIPVSFVFTQSLRALFINFNSIQFLFGSPFFAQSQITHLNFYSNNIQAIGQFFFFGLSGLRYLVLSGNNLQTIAPLSLAPLVNMRIFLASSNQISTLSGRLFETNQLVEFIGLEYNSISSLGPNIFANLPNIEYIGLSDNACVDGYFNINEDNTIDVVNDALQTCFDNAIPEPPITRQLVLELRGNMTLVNEYNDEIFRIEGRVW